MTMHPSPWAPRPGYQRSSALPQTSTDPDPLPGAGQRYQVHRESQGADPSRTSGPEDARQQPKQAASLIPSGIPAKAGAIVMLTAIVVFSLCTLYVFSRLRREFGPVVLPSFELALIPLGGVLVATMLLAGVFWYVRWEPRPPGVFTAVTLMVAFLWGTIVSTLCSLVVNDWVDRVITEAMGDPGAAAVISAPLVEELTKGLGVLLVFLIWRRTINGTIDGVVYAAFTAAGFAFVENILYFVQGWEYVGTIFVTRGILSPFAHLTFTACTGVAIGVSSRRRSQYAWAWMALVGLVGAILLHATWNGFVTANFGVYLLLQFPFYALCIGLVSWLRWSERRSMRRGIDDYAHAGWFSPAEVQMLTTGKGRRLGRRWAVPRGPQAVYAMAVFQKTASELAQLRQQAVDGHAQADFSAKESELLDRITLARRTFLRGQ